MRINIRTLLKNFNESLAQIEALGTEKFCAIYDVDGSVLCVASTAAQWTGGSPFDISVYDLQVASMNITKVSSTALRNRPYGSEADGLYKLLTTYRPINDIADQRVEAECVILLVEGDGDYMRFVAWEPGSFGNEMTLRVVIPEPDSDLEFVTDGSGLHHTLYPATDSEGAATSTTGDVSTYMSLNQHKHLVRMSSAGPGIIPLEEHEAQSFVLGAGSLPEPWPVFEITKNGSTVLWLTAQGHVNWIGYEVVTDL